MPGRSRRRSRTQVAALTGLNQQAKGLYRDENVFEDADIQMAGYAAALRVLTRYAVIDGRDMTAEAIRPRVKGETTFVDGLIALRGRHRQPMPRAAAASRSATGTSSRGAERFYLKMLETGGSRRARRSTTTRTSPRRSRSATSRPSWATTAPTTPGSRRAVEFGRAEMSEGSELYGSVLRAVLYAVMELVKDVDGARCWRT